MSADIPRLTDIVYTVQTRRQTVSIYNLDASNRVVQALSEYFSNQSVQLRRSRTNETVPKNFAVLHKGDEFLAASGLIPLYDAIRPDAPLSKESHPEEISQPEVLSRISRTEFSSYNRARMVNISRVIERAAWDANEGELHTGFQRLSNARDQWSLYSRLAASDLDVHIYGAPDWEVPPSDAIVHAYGDAEITRTWFVVADCPAGPSRALLAEERGPGEFYGFWTDESRVVDTILERLRTEYPPTDGAA